MDNYEFNLPIVDEPGAPIGVGISNAFQHVISQSVNDIVPQYLNEFPFLRGISAKIYSNDTMMVFTAKYGLHMNMVSLGTLKDPELRRDLSRRFSPKFIKKLLCGSHDVSVLLFDL